MNKLNKVQIISTIIVIIIILVILFFTIQNKTEAKEVKKEIEKQEVEKLKYKIDKLEVSKYNDSNRKSYSLYEENINCNLSITTYDITDYNNYKDGEEYIKNNETMYIGDTILEQETISINNNKWDYIHIRENRKDYNNSLKDIFYYSIIKNKKAYLITYKITDDSREANSSNSQCIKEKDKFINSLKFN